MINFLSACQDVCLPILLPVCLSVRMFVCCVVCLSLIHINTHFNAKVTHIQLEQNIIADGEIKGKNSYTV